MEDPLDGDKIGEARSTMASNTKGSLIFPLSLRMVLKNQKLKKAQTRVTASI